MDVMSVSLSYLPLPGPNIHWVIRRKAALIKAVRTGTMTKEEACLRYALSPEEYGSWERLVERHGVKGLRATHVQELRRIEMQRNPRSIVLDDFGR